MTWITIYLVVLLACGYFAAGLLMDGLRPRRLIEIAGMSIALGCGVLPLMLLSLSMLGIAPSRGVILILAALALAGLGFMKSTGRLPRIDRPLVQKVKGFEPLVLPVGLILIALQIGVVASSSLKPVVDVDAWNIWGLKAKVLYSQPLSPRPDYFTDLSLSYTHLDYPLLVPMLWAGAYGMMGTMDDAAGKLWQIVPLIGIVLLLYGALRDTLDRGRAMLLTALAIGSPAVARWGGQGLADTTLALFLLGTGICIARWIRHRVPRDLIAAALFAAFAGWTKLEGSIVLISAFLTVIVAATFNRSRIRDLIVFTIIAILMMLPWWLWSRGLPQTHENYLSRLTPENLRAGIERFPQLLSLISIQLRGWHWWIPILVLLAAAIAGFRALRERDVLAIWLILIFQLLACLVAYLITPWDLKELVPMTTMRLAMQIAPLGMYLTGRHWQLLLARNGS